MASNIWHAYQRMIPDWTFSQHINLPQKLYHSFLSSPQKVAWNPEFRESPIIFREIWVGAFFFKTT